MKRESKIHKWVSNREFYNITKRQENPSCIIHTAYPYNKTDYPTEVEVISSRGEKKVFKVKSISQDYKALYIQLIKS